jgi:hypothetical protein
VDKALARVTRLLDGLIPVLGWANILFMGFFCTYAWPAQVNSGSLTGIGDGEVGNVFTPIPPTGMTISLTQLLRQMECRSEKM